MSSGDAGVSGDGRSVLVIGAGISGLSAAHFLTQAGFDVEIRESAARAGGLIGTLETPYGPVETAANGLLNSALVEDTMAALGVALRPVSREARARFIFRGGRPRRWPFSFSENFKVLASLARTALTAGSFAPRAGESVRQWGSRVLSPSASRYSVETALQGIYAGDPERMSARLILGPLFEKKPAGPARRLRFYGTVAPVGGMERLIEGFQNSLANRGARLELRTEVVADDLRAARRPVVIATGADRAQTILEPLDAGRAQALRTIEMLPLVSVGAHFPKGSSPWRGFGCLFPPGEAKVLGVLWNDFLFGSRPEAASETWILGGALFRAPAVRSVTDLSDREILNIVREERLRVTGDDVEPLHYRVTRWPRALPHFTLNLEEAALRFRPNRSNLYLLGNYTGGIGLAKILEQAANLPAEIADTGAWS